MGKPHIILLLALLALPLLAGGAFAEPAKTVGVKFFYGPGCPHCANLSQHLDSLKGEYGDAISVEKINVNEGWQEFLGLQKQHGIPVSEYGSVPKVFIGDFYCIGDRPCIESVRGAIEEHKACGPPNGGEEEPCPPIGEKGHNINIIELGVLAFIDAINPCEIAVLVILLTSIMTRYPKQRRKALAAGLAFSAAIFIMYFVFGLLLIGGIQAVGGMSGGLNVLMVSFTGLTFYQLLGILAILMGLLNIKDAIWYKGGGFVMEVPESWRPRMKQILYSVGAKKREKPKKGEKDCPGCGVMETDTIIGLLKSKSYLIGAFLAGIIVSFFLTPCTAQAYVIAAGILSEFPLMVMLPYLLFYLGIFIAPMVGITLVIYAGFVAVEDVSGWRERNIQNLHWAVGLLLILLGLAIIMGLLRMPI